jgi:hypothetical protein
MLQLGADTEAVAWLLRSIEAIRSYPLAHFEVVTVRLEMIALSQRPSIQYQYSGRVLISFGPQERSKICRHFRGSPS